MKLQPPDRADFPIFSQEAWAWLCDSAPVRPDVVADARARLAAGQGPVPLQVADALLAACV